MTHQPPSPPPDIFSISFETPPPNVRLGGLFRTLFFNPLGLVFYLGREKLGRSLIRVLSIAFLCGLLLSVARIPKIYEDVADWIPWLQSEMRDMSLNDGTLSWTPAAELPYSRHFKGWRVTFSDKLATDFDPRARYGPESKGVWICPQAVVTWKRVEGRDALNYQKMKMTTVFRAITASPHDTAETGDMPVSFDGRDQLVIVTLLSVGLGAGTILGIFGDVIFYSFLFAVIPFILRSDRKKGVFSQAISFYLNISLVPLLVATVYTLFRVPMLDFKTVFSFSFMLYIIFIIFGTRWRFRQARRKEENR